MFDWGLVLAKLVNSASSKLRLLKLVFSLSFDLDVTSFPIDCSAGLACISISSSFSFKIKFNESLNVWLLLFLFLFLLILLLLVTLQQILFSLLHLDTSSTFKAFMLLLWLVLLIDSWLAFEIFFWFRLANDKDESAWLLVVVQAPDKTMWLFMLVLAIWALKLAIKEGMVVVLAAAELEEGKFKQAPFLLLLKFFRLFMLNILLSRLGLFEQVIYLQHSMLFSLINFSSLKFAAFSLFKYCKVIDDWDELWWLDCDDVLK